MPYQTASGKHIYSLTQKHFWALWVVSFCLTTIRWLNIVYSLSFWVLLKLKIRGLAALIGRSAGAGCYSQSLPATCCLLCLCCLCFCSSSNRTVQKRKEWQQTKHKHLLCLCFDTGLRFRYSLLILYLVRPLKPMKSAIGSHRSAQKDFYRTSNYRYRRLVAFRQNAGSALA